MVLLADHEVRKRSYRCRTAKDRAKHHEFRRLMNVFG